MGTSTDVERAIDGAGASVDRESMDSEAFRDVIGRFASGVTVVTAVDHGRGYGTTASAVSSLCLEPPMLLVCMNRESATGRAMARVGRFAVNILGEEQSALARRFARKGHDTFSDLNTALGPSGQLLLDGALAHLECRVVRVISEGTHQIFLSSVTYASGAAGRPLAYFRGRFGRLLLDVELGDH